MIAGIHIARAPNTYNYLSIRKQELGTRGVGGYCGCTASFMKLGKRKAVRATKTSTQVLIPNIFQIICLMKASTWLLARKESQKLPDRLMTCR